MNNIILRDMKEYASHVAEVRKTGLVNMLDRKGVISVLEEMGDDITAKYIENNKKDYMKLLEESKNY